MEVKLSIGGTAEAAGAAGSGGVGHVQPFRAFFFLAAVDAIAGVGVLLVASAGIVPPDWAGVPVGVWHRQELLFGMVPAGLAGFLLTALPRWTARSPISPLALRALIALWLAGRAAHIAAPAAAGPLAAIFIIVLALIVAYQVIAAGDRRDIKIGVLLALLAVGAVTAGDQSFGAAGEYGSRLSLAAILGFIIIVGGRVIPSVTAAALAEPAEIFRTRSSMWIEPAAAVAAAVGLGAFVVAPALDATALACAVAAVGQAARLVQWRMWRTMMMPAVLVHHLGYGWIAIGFAFAGVRLLHRDLGGTDAVVHAWAVGVIGVMCLGVWASMIRRQTGAAFEFSTSVVAAYGCAFIAAVARVVAAVPAGMDMMWLRLGAFAWIAAYALFLIGFARKLLRRPSTPAQPIVGP